MHTSRLHAEERTAASDDGDVRTRILAPLPVVDLIWGRDDLQVRLRIPESASERYGWPLRVIEDARDDPAIERPEAFLGARRATLTRDERELTTADRSTS